MRHLETYQVKMIFHIIVMALPISNATFFIVILNFSLYEIFIGFPCIFN